MMTSKSAENDTNDNSDKKEEVKSTLSSRPHVTDTYVVQSMELLYGFKVNHMQELDSYCDRNYHVIVDSKHSNPHITEICKHGYVFKVLNVTESTNTHVDAEIEAMQLLSKSGFSCPQHVPNLHGEYRSLEIIHREHSTENVENNGPAQEVNSDPEHIVRLLTYLPGKRLADITPTPGILYDAGQKLAQLDRILQDYTHPSLEKYTEWHIDNTASYRLLLDSVDNIQQQQLIQQALLTFEQEVVPMYPHFRKGTIHCDYHEDNIIIQPSSVGTDHVTYHISGVIDFGELTHFYYILEVGLALAHAMMISPKDAIQFSGHALAGYQSIMELSEEELKSLPAVIGVRLAQILTLCPVNSRQDPDNEYITHWIQPAWLTLQMLSTIPKENILHEWKEVIQSYDKVTLPKYPGQMMCFPI